MMRKITKLIAVLAILLCLSGCSSLDSKVNDIIGEIRGNEYLVDTFDNSGNLVAQFSGEKISIKGNYVKPSIWDKVFSEKEASGKPELSAVITVNIDGNEIQSCGDTLVFYDKRLTPDVAFDPNFSFESSSNGILDWTKISGKLNEVKNLIGKERIVLIKSQLGNPIYAFSGDKVYWEIPDDLPKFSKLMVDGKAVYIHRANFQIIDKKLLD